MVKGISILGVLIGVALIVFIAPHLLSHNGSISILPAHAAAATLVVPTPTLSATQENDMAAEEAALAGAQAFYSVDYQQGMQTWLDHLCSASTETGCSIYQSIFGPKLWDGFEKAKTVTTAQASAEEKVEDQVTSARDNAPLQVWRLHVHLSAPWPQQKEPQLDFTALALVVKEKGAWKFERFLTEEEAQAVK